MNETCISYRDLWLLARGDGMDGGHSQSCADCREWARSTARQLRALGELSRLPSPPELEERVTLELSGDRSARFERLLGSLVRRGTPAALDDRVAALFEESPTNEGAERRANYLKALDRRSSPPVLERLVGEELEDPPLHQAERFPGNLERLSAPRDLEHRLESRVRRRALLRLVGGPLLTLAAAGVVIWLTLRQAEDSPRAYPFRVVRAATLDGLDPMARALAESLGGYAGAKR